MTNFEKIKEKSVLEMAVFISTLVPHDTINLLGLTTENFIVNVKKWLESEAEE